MLQRLRDQTQTLGFKILVGAIVLVLAVFGFGAFNLFISTDPEVASVNGTEITRNELLQATEREKRRIAAQYEDVDPATLDSAALSQSVLERLISRTLLEQIIHDYGLGASKKRVDTRILTDESFQVDGRFDENRYQMIVRSLGFNPTGYADEMRMTLALEHLRSGVADSSFLLNWENRAIARLVNQKRDVAYLTFSPDDFMADVSVTDERVHRHYDENKRQYVTEEKLDVEFVEFDRSALYDQVEVSDDEVLAAYEDELKSMAPAEQRRVSQILLHVDDDRTESEAIAEAEALRQRVLEGEDFATLAREVSDDAGSAPAGGDLGFAGPGVYPPEFEQALWGLTEGELSPPVVSSFGVHLIRLDAIRQAELPPFELRRGDLMAQLRRAKVGPLFDERVRAMDALAFEQPSSLAPLVDEFGLEIRTVSGVTEAAGAAGFDDPKLLAAAFTPEVIEDGNNTPAIVLDDDRVLVARTTAHHAAAQIPFEDVEEQIRSDLTATEAALRAEEKLQEALTRLRAGESAGDVADDYGLEWRTVAEARRSMPGVPRSILDTAFALPRPPTGGKSLGLDEQIKAVVSVTRIIDADISTMTDTERQAMEDYLVNRARELDFSALYKTVEADASISRG